MSASGRTDKRVEHVKCIGLDGWPQLLMLNVVFAPPVTPAPEENRARDNFYARV